MSKKTKAKKAVKALKTSTKKTTSTKAAKPRAGSSIKSGISAALSKTPVGVGISAAKSIAGMGGGKARVTGMRKKISAKQLLKRAYERRAKRQIHLQQLGLARKTLRKKATVI